MPQVHTLLKLAIVLAAIAQPAAAAGECKSTGCIFTLQGPIFPASVAALQSKLASRPPGASVLLLVDSEGGDVEAAMALGRAIRAAAPVSVIVSQSDCLSSCVLAIAGATNRQLKAGRVGIHRPYSNGPPAASFLANATRFKELEGRIRLYLNEMNLPPALLDEMLRYEPQTMHILTQEELSRFRLEGSDYIWQDQIDSRLAQIYGLDKGTYLSRRAKAESSCKQSLNTPESAQSWINCKETILRGK
jgi:hypothetical protein